MVTKTQLLKTVKAMTNGRSAWCKSVKADAIDLINYSNDLEKYSFNRWLELEKALLNGARDWKQYSYGGRALCCDTDIAKRYCNTSEFKMTKGGINRPNNKESWLDVQARALYQASEMIKEAFYKLQETQKGRY